MDFNNVFTPSENSCKLINDKHEGLRGFALRWTDICDCRVTFVSKKLEEDSWVTISLGEQQLKENQCPNF